MNVQSIPKWLRTVINSVAYYPIRLFVIGPFVTRFPLVRGLVFNAVNYTTRSLLYSKVGPEHFVVDSTDRIIGYGVFTRGSFEFERVERVLRKLGIEPKDGQRLDRLIDIGANIGTVCVPIVGRGYADGAVAIEPAPRNANLLRANIALNGLARKIEVRECALDAEGVGDLVLELSDVNLGDHRVRVTDEPGCMQEEARATLRVPAHRLDDIWLPEPGSKELIWIDVQGYEGYALNGAKKWLAAGVPVCTEFWPYGLKRSGGYQSFKSVFAGYRGFYDLNEIDNLRPLEQLDVLYEAVGEDGAWTDLLFVSERTDGSRARPAEHSDRNMAPSAGCRAVHHSIEV